MTLATASATVTVADIPGLDPTPPFTPLEERSAGGIPLIELPSGHRALHLTRYADVLKASPTRAVVALLHEPEGTARTCASFNLPVSKSTTTHHFRTLREADLVRQVNRGNSRAATLRKDDLDKRFPGLLDLIHANS